MTTQLTNLLLLQLRFWRYHDKRLFAGCVGRNGVSGIQSLCAFRNMISFTVSTSRVDEEICGVTMRQSHSAFCVDCILQSIHIPRNEIDSEGLPN